MRIGVADLKLEMGLHKTVPVQIQLEPIEFTGQVFHFDQLFTGKAEIWNTGAELLVRVTLTGATLVQCSRCLSPVLVPLDLSFEEDFMEGRPPADEDEDEELLQERNVTYFSGDELDLTESLRDNVLLELPMKPLCSAACQGLCPGCGANLNEGACSCKGEETAVDPRLAGLRDLLRRPDSNS